MGDGSREGEHGCRGHSAPDHDQCHWPDGVDASRRHARGGRPMPTAIRMPPRTPGDLPAPRGGGVARPALSRVGLPTRVPSRVARRASCFSVWHPVTTCSQAASALLHRGSRLRPAVRLPVCVCNWGRAQREGSLRGQGLAAATVGPARSRFSEKGGADVGLPLGGVGSPLVGLPPSARWRRVTPRRTGVGPGGILAGFCRPRQAASAPLRRSRSGRR